MSYGTKILELRKSKNMTQAALGAELNVTYQAVSKWERDESDPDFATMCKIARLFGVPLTYFESDEDAPAPEKSDENAPAGENAEAPVEAPAVDNPAAELALSEVQAVVAENDTPVAPAEDDASDGGDTPVEDNAPLNENAPVAPAPIPLLIGVCSTCGTSIYDKAELGARYPKLLCKSCKQRADAQKAREEARKAQEERTRKENERRRIAYEQAAIRRKRNRGLIAAAIIVGLLFVAGIVGTIMNGEGVLYGILGSFVSLIFLYTFVAQLFWGGVVLDVCLTGGKWIGMPGIIFSLDLDGIIFLIVMKIIFAIIRFLVFILILLFFVAVAIIISPFTFIPQLIKLNRGEEL